MSFTPPWLLGSKFASKTFCLCYGGGGGGGVVSQSLVKIYLASK